MTYILKLMFCGKLIFNSQIVLLPLFIETASFNILEFVTALQ